MIGEHLALPDLSAVLRTSKALSAPLMKHFFWRRAFQEEPNLLAWSCRVGNNDVFTRLLIERQRLIGRGRPMPARHDYENLAGITFLQHGPYDI